MSKRKLNYGNFIFILNLANWLNYQLARIHVNDQINISLFYANIQRNLGSFKYLNLLNLYNY